MGCDIHLHVEVSLRLEFGSERRWRQVRRRLTVEVGGTEHSRAMGWYKDRNYDAFAILAGVRNGEGFAGIDTGDGYVPLAPPKGLPDDCSHGISRSAQEWGLDGHSHSWLTLRELQATPEYWDQETKQRGVVTKKQAEAYRTTGALPREWAGDITPFPHDTHERLEWGTVYRNDARDLHDGLIPAMRELLGWGGLATLHRTEDRDYLTPDDVRAVFWFDN